MLLGRDGELKQVDGLLDAVSAGDGAVVLLHGAAGFGKTALLAEATRRAHDRDFLVLRAGGAQLEREYAFGVVRDLFAAVVAPGRSHGDLLEGAAGLAAVPLGLGSATADAGGEWGDRASAAMHGLYWLTARVAERSPVLLAIDDAHWADVMSLRFVLYLARRLDDLPVLIVVAAGPAADHDEEQLLSQLESLPGVTSLRPAPLSVAHTAQLIAERGVPEGDGEFVAACQHATGGNPFLLGELVSRLQGDGVRGSAADAARVAGIAPKGIVRWVSSRLAALGEDAQLVAGAYGVLGAGASLADVSLLAGLETAPAAEAADTLIAAGILTAEQPHEFVQPLVRATVHDGLPAARRADWHARAARLAEARDGAVGVVAAHLLAAGPDGDAWAIGVLRSAARDATASGAPGSAARYLERALREAPPRELRGDLLLELGEARLHAGIAGATDSMREALAVRTDARQRAEVALMLGQALFSTGKVEEAQESFAQGMAEIADTEDDLFLELRAWYTADTRHEPELSEQAQQRLQALLDGSSPGRTRAERLLLAHMAYRAARSGERTADSVARLARRALADGALLAESGRDIGPYSAVCHALAAAGSPDAALDELDRAVELSQRHGSLVAFGWFSHLRGITQYQCGHLIDAIGDLEASMTAYLDGYGHALPDTRAFLALCLIERDDLDAAVQALALADPDGLEPEAAQPRSASYQYALGRLRAAHGRLEEALTAVMDCEPWVRATNADNPAANIAWRAEAAQLAARLGDQDRGWDLLADTIDRARAFGAPHALGIALRAAGVIEGGPGGLDWLAQAVTVLDGSGSTLQLGRTLIEQGGALRRAGQRRDALAPLRRGLDLASGCGAVALSKRAREDLVAVGARPRRERISGADALTASEVRVARMAAEGMSNPQIAQALFVTRRTVKTHLTSVYRKLDIARRDHLADALGRERVAA
ncbi:MAG: AAA family ATPase [Solirubrobacteraceae bacterium]